MCLAAVCRPEVAPTPAATSNTTSCTITRTLAAETRLLRRITGLARLSVRPSVCPLHAPKSKTKKSKKLHERSPLQEKSVCQFVAKNGKG